MRVVITFETGKYSFRVFSYKAYNACMYYRRMKSVLLLLTPSLNDRRKLKGQCTDHTSVGSSSNPHSLSFKKFLSYCPFKFLVLLSRINILNLNMPGDFFSSPKSNPSGPLINMLKVFWNTVYILGDICTVCVLKVQKILSSPRCH